jgi:SAM-dependent methyltransferase
VVDIGCGTGLTTGEAARAAAPGRVVGVDVSARMLEGAHQVTTAERLENLRYELRLAQVHRSDHAGFDGTISRFGTMFFSDPGAAFGNIAAALRPGRAWCYSSDRDGDNERARAIDGALGDAAQPARAGTDRFRSGCRRDRGPSCGRPVRRHALRGRARTGPLRTRPRRDARPSAVDPAGIFHVEGSGAPRVDRAPWPMSPPIRRTPTHSRGCRAACSASCRAPSRRWAILELVALQQTIPTLERTGLAGGHICHLGRRQRARRT